MQYTHKNSVQFKILHNHFFELIELSTYKSNVLDCSERLLNRNKKKYSFYQNFILFLNRVSI